MESAQRGCFTTMALAQSLLIYEEKLTKSWAMKINEEKVSYGEAY